MGNTVTLKATAKAGYRFVSWAGSLAGSDSETVVILSEDLQATALFEKTPITKGWQWSDTFPWVFSEREKNWLYFQAVGNKLKVYSYADGLWRDMK